MNGTIFNIQKFCINDGPGIRTTVFFKGCPLNCAWCHNPESKSVNPEIMYNETVCCFCGECVKVCENGCHEISANAHIFNRQNCTMCGKCFAACPAKALETAGELKSTNDVLSEVLKDKVFYDNSGGGLTVSGGEPMLQFDFLYELLHKAKAHNLNVCIETCGFYETEKYIKIAEYVDIFLFDWKLTDKELHKKYTGVSNSLIENNLKTLDSLGSKIILRCPIIPGINDTENHFSGIAQISKQLKNIIEINIEPYHPLGESKCERLGYNSLLKNIPTPSAAQTDLWIKQLQDKTDVKVCKA